MSHPAKIPCPRCGNPKFPKSKLCRPCTNKAQLEKGKVQFNPETCCGAKVRSRNPEYLQMAIKRATLQLKALKTSVPDYDLRKLHLLRTLTTAEAKLAKVTANPDDRPCVRPKGYATDHKGEGYCKFHCACHGRRGFHSVTGDVYRQIKNRQLQEVITLVEAQTLDIMDLMPEARMLKALTIVFFEQTQQKKQITTKDIEAACTLIDKTGKTIERINSIRLKSGLVTHDAVHRLTAEMMRWLYFHANELNGKILDAEAFVQAVKASWATIVIQADAKPIPIPQHSRLAT